MITFKTGNIFEEDSEAIVNTVNCVGIMGRGIALQFKKNIQLTLKLMPKQQNIAKLSQERCLFLKITRILLQNILLIFLLSAIGVTKAVFQIFNPAYKHWQKQFKKKNSINCLTSLRLRIGWIKLGRSTPAYCKYF